MRRAHNAEFESRNQPLQLVDNFGSILADKLRMKRNPCCPDFFPVCQLTHSSKPVQAAGQTLRIQVLGLATIAPDVPPELAQATISEISVLGALHASPAVKAALAGRIR